MFKDFDFNILNDSEFKEDSVREELIAPIIKKLGYKPSGSSKVVRSRCLKHPFLSIGSTRTKLTLVPDYLFTYKDSPYWILDAKSPSENIYKTKHVEQVYSYAIHPEVRADYYALCNGHRFSLYYIKNIEPILDFELSHIDENFDVLYKLLNTEKKANHEVGEYLMDLGLHLHKLGVKPNFTFINYSINSNYIAKVEDGLYTASTSIDSGVVGVECALSLDFKEELYQKLLLLLPSRLSTNLEDSLKRQPYQSFIQGEDYQFGVIAKLSSNIVTNAEESYIPFIVEEFLPYKDL